MIFIWPILHIQQKTHDFYIQFGWFTSKPLVPIRIMCEVRINCLNYLLNILYSKMCSIRGGDFRNQFSVFGLYVMPTHG